MAEAPVEKVPRISRRHAVGAESARGLLFTILGEFVLPSGGAAWTATLIDALGRVEVEEKAARQALMRTAANGWLIAERVGRRARWELSANAVSLLTDGAKRIYGFTGPPTSWDGRWVVVLVRVPDSDRPSRHVLRTRLEWAGFGSPTPGVWISAHADRVPAAERCLEEAGLISEARIFVSEYAGGGDLQSMVAAAWDLSALDAAYRDFISRFSAGRHTDPIARVIELVHAWRRYPWIDPALPVELLPPRWPGTRAAEIFERRHSQWSPDARATWNDLDRDPS